MREENIENTLTISEIIFWKWLILPQPSFYEKYPRITTPALEITKYILPNINIKDIFIRTDKAPSDVKTTPNIRVYQTISEGNGWTSKEFILSIPLRTKDMDSKMIEIIKLLKEQQLQSIQYIGV